MLHHKALLGEAISEPDPGGKILAMDIRCPIFYLANVLDVEEEGLGKHECKLDGYLA